MKAFPGTIRIVLGIIILFGVAGTVDADPTVGLDVLAGLCAIAVVSLYSGILAAFPRGR